VRFGASRVERARSPVMRVLAFSKLVVKETSVLLPIRAMYEPITPPWPSPEKIGRPYGEEAGAQLLRLAPNQLITQGVEMPATAIYHHFAALLATLGTSVPGK